MLLLLLLLLLHLLLLLLWVVGVEGGGGGARAQIYEGRSHPVKGLRKRLGVGVGGENLKGRVDGAPCLEDGCCC
jgi:hypothetical protein